MYKAGTKKRMFLTDANTIEPLAIHKNIQDEEGDEGPQLWGRNKRRFGLQVSRKWGRNSGQASAETS